MDTLFATKKAKKSSRGHTCAQLFVTDKGFVHVVPMKSKRHVPQAMKEFAKVIGAPDSIITDAAREETSAAIKAFCREIDTELRILERGTQWANRAELHIGILKEAVSKDMREANSPLAFWDYCLERRVRINNLTAKDLFQLHGTNAHTATLNMEGDISNLSQFGWHEWGHYGEASSRFPYPRDVLCRVLGPSAGSGNEMSQWALKANGQIVPRRTIRPLTPQETQRDSEERKKERNDG